MWDVTVFTKNRGRLIAGDIAAQFMAAVLNQERERCGPRRNRRASFVAAGSSPRWPLWQVFPGSGHGQFRSGSLRCSHAQDCGEAAAIPGPTGAPAMEGAVTRRARPPLQRLRDGLPLAYPSGGRALF